MYWAWIEIDRTVANACAHTFLPTVAHLSICMGRERESVCACVNWRERVRERAIYHGALLLKRRRILGLAHPYNKLGMCHMMVLEISGSFIKRTSLVRMLNETV